MIELTQAPGGDTLTLERLPVRIVSLVPSITETMIEFGMMPVGRSSFCIEPKKHVDNIPRVGGTKTPNIQRIVKLKPDLVIANLEENTKKDVDTLLDLNIPVWVTYPKSVCDSLDMMAELALLGANQESATNMLNTYRKYLEQKPSGTNKSVLIFIWKDPWMVVGKDSYTNDLIEFSGGQNACLDARYPELTEDQIVEIRPDIILLPNEPYKFEKSDVAFWKEKLPATHVLQFSGEDLFWSGFRAIHASEKLSDIFLESS